MAFMPGSYDMGGGVPMDERTLDEMLGISTLPEERKALERQIRMAELLGTSAIKYNPNAGKGRGIRANVGGAANALAQGMQGWMSGTMDKRNQTTDAELMRRERQAREQWMRAQHGMPQAGAATPTAYSDSGQPEIRRLPDEDENDPNAAMGYPY